mmetsp:Transcript_17423/g.40986  ORF Transcript_17423/g.40986 Transcript_17423/m.40986 type:complete len:336 (+) Transcript_17423:650-1657(+)
MPLLPFWQAIVKAVLPVSSRMSTGHPEARIAITSARRPWRTLEKSGLYKAASGCGSLGAAGYSPPPPSSSSSGPRSDDLWAGKLDGGGDCACVLGRDTEGVSSPCGVVASESARGAPRSPKLVPAKISGRAMDAAMASACRSARPACCRIISALSSSPNASPRPSASGVVDPRSSSAPAPVPRNLRCARMAARRSCSASACATGSSRNSSFSAASLAASSAAAAASCRALRRAARAASVASSSLSTCLTRSLSSSDTTPLPPGGAMTVDTAGPTSESVSRLLYSRCRVVSMDWIRESRCDLVAALRGSRRTVPAGCGSESDRSSSLSSLCCSLLL